MRNVCVCCGVLMTPLGGGNTCFANADGLTWSTAKIKEEIKMKLKLHDAIGSMDYDDLVELNRDLQQGGASIKQLVSEKIVQKEKEMGKHCVACHTEIDPSRTSNFTLLFGPEGLRRKATFCALDCLKYFITDLEKRNEEYKRRSMRKDEN